jgi:hypothetical protein
LTEIELLLALYHNPRTREVALEMADKMRDRANPVLGIASAVKAATEKTNGVR